MAPGPLPAQICRADFAKIPDDDPAAFVKASVPGTTEAKDAVLLASIPTKTVTTMADPPAGAGEL